MHKSFVPPAGALELVEREAWLDLFAAAPGGCVHNLGLSSQLLGEIGVLASRKVPIVEFNRAMCIGVVGPVVEAELEEVSAWLRTNAAPGWALQITPPAQTRAIYDWLHRRALTTSGMGWAKLRRGISSVTDAERSGIHVRLVNADSAATFGEVVQTGFGLPVATAEWFAALYGRPGWHLYLAYDRKKPVACGAAFTRHGVAWFGIDTTHPEHRRRGGQTALIKRRLEDGLANQLSGFTAETGQPSANQEAAHTSYSNYIRAGFTPAYLRSNYKPSFQSI